MESRLVGYLELLYGVFSRCSSHMLTAQFGLFWHRGLSLSDIALGHAMLKKGEALGIGQRLRFG